MSFWQCPVCVRQSYFCDKTHLKLHLMSEHNISGRTLTKMIEGLTSAFESYSDGSGREDSMYEDESLYESKQQEEGVHQQ